MLILRYPLITILTIRSFLSIISLLGLIYMYGIYNPAIIPKNIISTSCKILKYYILLTIIHTF